MLNYIWSFMILVSIIFATINGRLDALASEALGASKDAVSMLSLIHI